MPLAVSGEFQQTFTSTLPQEYKVQTALQSLTLETPYYTVRHSLKQGGAIAGIHLTHRYQENLLVGPIETRIRDESGTVFSDLYDDAARESHAHVGLNEQVTTERELRDEHGRGSGVKAKTVFEYRWGYIKARTEYRFPPGGFKAAELTVFRMRLSGSLTDYGYREGTTEAEGAPPFSFGSCKWGKISAGSIKTKYLPRYWMFADPGREGVEWFMGSDLGKWELQLTGHRGDGQCSVEKGDGGFVLTIAPLWRTNGSVLLTNSCVFDYYLGIPLLEGHAWAPWLHTSFNRNQGNWVSAEQIKAWADQGYQTVHCHNDGDYYGDGLFWRDGSYPPYPDMENYDKVIAECRKVGIGTATYFSNKELHPSTDAYKEHGQEWARKDLKGGIQHNFFKENSEFGAQMCLRSGWLEFLKGSIDRVLTNHRLNGVYYDWNVALLCCNPLHEGLKADERGAGHWDIDELLDLMEWTRQRVGTSGLIIVHNTTTPMFATENFANYIVANEWGYGKWSGNGAALNELPLEWTLVGARPRGVISYGQLDAKSPRRLHRLFAIEALLGGVAPWPASPETFELLPILKPIGEIQSCRFADWRNPAVKLQGPRVGSAVYSLQNEAFILIANMEPEPCAALCFVDPGRLPYPLKKISDAVLLKAGTQESMKALDANALSGRGVNVQLPADGMVLFRLR